MHISNFKWKRCLILGIVIITLTLSLLVVYSLWTPGKDVIDGSHDRKHNGIWLQHGWLGDDEWFERNNRQKLISYFRNVNNTRQLASILKDHHITDLYPHLCPALPDGVIPAVDEKQTKLFLKEFVDFRVMPWVGGVSGVQAFPANPDWRKTFTQSICQLLQQFPQFKGIHINIEPCRSGNADFINLLQQLRTALPEDKILSVAAYPPPTIWHPFPEVHWDEDYYRQVTLYADQVVVMSYDTAIHLEKIYQHVMADWSRKALTWSGGKSVLLGVPAYDDEGVGYHTPKVENISNALLGIHAGLRSFKLLPKNYQGVALYCEWKMDETEWQYLKKHFLNTEQKKQYHTPRK